MGLKHLKLLKSKISKSPLSIALIAIAFIALSIFLSLSVFANTHTSTVEITSCTTIGDYGECIIAGGVIGQDFDLEVCNDVGSPHDVREFRIYYEWEDFTDFENVQCESKTGWDKAVLNTIWGYACIYSSEDENNNIKPGECTNFEFTADTPEEECCRELRFETTDEETPIGDVNRIDAQVCVDATDPETTKILGDPHYPIPLVEGEPEWISTSTLITLDAIDPQPHPSGVAETLYMNLLAEDAVEAMDLQVDPNLPCEDIDYCELMLLKIKNNPDHDYLEGKWQLYDEPFTKEEESCHLLVYYSIDEVENDEEMQINCFFVDNTPPLSVKEHGTPLIEGDGFDWVTQDTIITLDCDDSWDGQVPHPVNQEYLCFKVSFDLDPDGYITDKYCDPAYYDGEFTAGEDSSCDTCCIYVGDEPFKLKFLEDSYHDLKYYCVDHLGNSELDLEWMNGEPHVQYYKVDSTPPIITKEMIGENHLGVCPPNPEPSDDECYVADDGENGVSILVEDGGEICAIDQVTCDYHLWWETSEQECIDAKGIRYHEENGWCLIYEDDMQTESPQSIIFSQDSTHFLEIECEDKLGNRAYELEEFLVDSTPPETTKEYGYPSVLGEYDYITSQTPITLTAVDEKVGVDVTQYRVSGVLADRFCEPQTCDSWMEILRPDMGEWNIYDTPFSIDQESCHVIEFRSIDKLGNEEEIDWQCVFVDNTAPEPTKTIKGPQYPEEGDLGEIHKYLTKDSTIYIECNDPDPHPVGGEILSWEMYWKEDNCDVDENWIFQTSGKEEGYKTFTKLGDSCHKFVYWCSDALGNVESAPHEEIDVVDNKAPEIIKEVEGPQIKCPEEVLLQNGMDCYQIDGVTKINVNAVDPQPHPVNEVICSWDYEVLDGDKIGQGEAEITPPFTITFPEESTHILTITCWDALSNKVTDVEKFIVDKTAPETTKTYEGPQYPKEGYPKWINSDTDIILEASDNIGPHDSGIKETKYRVTLVDDNYCEDRGACLEAQGSGEFIPYDTPFSIGQESCHLIEYYSVDGVDKIEVTKKQCVFVDNTGPNPIKTVGEPKAVWDVIEEPSVFYDIEEFCKEEGNCWKVTMLTPINMSCIDPEPHPVDNERVCFYVEIDGENETDMYCEYYYGNMNEENGYCCVDGMVEEFYFNEETEHNLAYYCEDALGNIGVEDDEKFKVEGTKFEIPLYKKWNLISVPFVLLIDDPAEVFKNATGVERVWMYDPLDAECALNDGWCIWSPEGPSNLKIKPGWGYWVLETEDEEWLTIGGSLMSPAETPPARTLVPGWNLIGYYGTSWLLYNDEFTEDYSLTCGEGLPWSDNPDKYIYGDKVYCALNSLIDTQEGYPRWSSLWSYINCGDYQTTWVGLNTCADEDDFQTMIDRMYAGRGYWIEMDVEDSYSPATTCIWNDDNICQWTGGGIIP